jgi:CDP-glucose 4,6-dehydratase
MEIEKLLASFKNKKVFITGHTGFKGTWLLSILNLFGAICKGYALKAQTYSDIYNQINANDFCENYEGDIKDAEKLKQEILNFEPDFLFHLAAQPLVRLSYETPLETFLVNTQGTANVLDALRFYNKKCVCIMITTDKVYSNLETSHFYNENDRLGGYDPYSASKACAELVIDSYKNSFFNSNNYSEHQKSISIARAGNVIGGGDWSKDRIIPDIVRALQNNETIKVRNPNSIRPWQHVLEPVLGYLVLATMQANDPLKYATTFNFGPKPSDTLPVSKLVNQAIAIWGGGTFENATNINTLHEATLLHLDITKADKLLNWQPKMNSEIAIKNTIEWYKELMINKKNIKEYTLQQIDNYLKKYNG